MARHHAIADDAPGPGVELSAGRIQTALRASVNAVFEDVIEDGEGFSDAVEHPDACAI